MKAKKKSKTLQSLSLTIPAGWGDLTPFQVQRVAYYLGLGLDETESLVRLGAEMADLKPRGARKVEGEIRYAYYHRDKGNVVLTSEHVAAIAEALKWISLDPEPMAAPPLDGYDVPDSNFYGISLEQFITADTACGAYVRLQDPFALRMLVASLYTRGKFDPDRLTFEAGRLGFLPVWQLQAVFLWYSGAKKMLFKKYPFVFSADAVEGPVAPGDEVLMGLLSSLNEGRISDNGTIKQTDVHEALFELNLKIKRSKTDHV